MGWNRAEDELGVGLCICMLCLTGHSEVPCPLLPRPVTPMLEDPLCSSVGKALASLCRAAPALPASAQRLLGEGRTCGPIRWARTAFGACPPVRAVVLEPVGWARESLQVKLP